ncbi:MAG: hypothetical protein WA775_06100 [Psychroserpens sp.]|uniref:hypothetical protein n=1 Tax=Psychroserpens sp. TaxID=2020870 RepID=UPI003C738085
MKTSTLLLVLLLFNSSVLFAQFANWLFAYVNPFAIVGAEIFLVIGYFFNNILKDVRKAFDVDFSM